ncbi:hypothetical protein V6N13_098131 [Hibiscus sabdariffa]
MAQFGVKRSVLRSILLNFLNFGIAFMLVSAERSLKHGETTKESETNNNYFLKAINFLWKSDESGYHHVWPEMELNWQIVLGSVIGFFGAAFGSVGGVGGGGIFVPMLSLIIGFDPKSATAISKSSTVYYNLKLRHPTLDMPIIDYDLALLIQPMLMMGISIGVVFNVIFADWMVTVLLIILFIGTSTKAFFKGVETWKKENHTEKDSDNGDVDYKPLPSGPPKDNTDKGVSVWENVCWKELGLLCFVWVAFLVLQIAKNNTGTCSVLYWVLNLLQIPVSVGVSLYEAVSLYKGTRSRWRVGGLLGLGGGFIMGPLFLELGVPPQVSSATATFAMTFSSSMSCCRILPFETFSSTLCSLLHCGGYRCCPCRTAHRPKADNFIRKGIFDHLHSSIHNICGVGISNMIGKIERHEYMGFENLCKYGS